MTTHDTNNDDEHGGDDPHAEHRDPTLVGILKLYFFFGIVSIFFCLLNVCSVAYTSIFFTVASSIAAEDYDERKSRACHWKSKKALRVLTYRKRLID